MLRCFIIWNVIQCGDHGENPSPRGGCWHLYCREQVAVEAGNWLDWLSGLRKRSVAVIRLFSCFLQMCWMFSDTLIKPPFLLPCLFVFLHFCRTGKMRNKSNMVCMLVHLILNVCMCIYICMFKFGCQNARWESNLIFRYCSHIPMEYLFTVVAIKNIQSLFSLTFLLSWGLCNKSFCLLAKWEKNMMK